MAKGKRHEPQLQGSVLTQPMEQEVMTESNGQDQTSINGDATGKNVDEYDYETTASAAQEFTARDVSGSTLREVFGYAHSAVVIGNGQWPHVPVPFDHGQIDGFRSVLAMALAVAQRGAANQMDDDYNALVRAARSKLDQGALKRSLLEEAVDNYLYKFNQLPNDQRPKAADGKAIQLRNQNGTPMTSAEDRLPLVEAILSLPADAPVGKVFPDGGDLWSDVIERELTQYIATKRPWNKRKTPEQKAAGTGRGRQSQTSQVSVFDSLT